MRRGLQVLTVLCFGACINTPTDVAVESSLMPSHVLTVTLAAACGLPPSSSFARFDLTVSGRLNPAGPAKFVAAPPKDERCNQSTLDLQLDIAASKAEGTIAGHECFVTGGVYTALFSRPGVLPGRLRGVVRQNDHGDLEVVNGILEGTINVGLKFSSDGVECVATDHMWSLRPMR